MTRCDLQPAPAPATGDERTFTLTVQAETPGRPWQARLRPARDGAPLAFTSPLALARHLAALDATPRTRPRGLR